MFKKENIRKNFLRVKQIADQNLGRAEKSEVLSDELIVVEKQVEQIKNVTTTTVKKIASTLQGTGPDYEKRLKKLSEAVLSHSMIESANILEQEEVMGQMFQMCGDCQYNLALKQLEYEIEVEKNVIEPLEQTLDTDIPAIAKLKKQLNKVTLDMDSAKSRWHNAVRQTQVPGVNMATASSKADTIKDELEEAKNKVDQAKDALATEMFKFIAKEPERSQKLLALLQAQENYHQKTLQILQDVIPKMKAVLDCNPCKPVYGTSLEEHLRVTTRDIALVLESCICYLLETGLDEEGLFRIAGIASRVKKLKASFDAGIQLEETEDLDQHTVAGALKQYLRELPEPLLTFDLYPEFLAVCQKPQDQRLQALWSVIDKLPKPNYNNFRYLIKFLSKLAERSDVNKMSPSNIAIVIGPNLIWSQGETGSGSTADCIDPDLPLQQAMPDLGQCSLLGVISRTNNIDQDLLAHYVMAYQGLCCLQLDLTYNPNMATTGVLTSLIELIITHADWFFPGEIDFHMTTRGSAPPHGGINQTRTTDQEATGHVQAIHKDKKSSGNSITNQFCEAILPAAMVSLTLQTDISSEPGSFPSSDITPLSKSSDSSLSEATNKVDVANCEPDTEGDSSTFKSSSPESVRSFSNFNTANTTNPVIKFNPMDRHKNQNNTRKSCPLPSAPVTPPKSIHSDVYDTAFALHSLGDGSWPDYLTKVRAMWDDQFQQRQVANSNKVLMGSSAGVIGGDRQPQGYGQEVQFSCTVYSEVGSPVFRKDSQNDQSYDHSKLEKTVSNQSVSDRTGSSSQGTPSYANHEMTSQGQMIPVITTPSPQESPSSSSNNLNQAPLADSEPDLLPTMRRQIRKPAPPPPPERPFSVAVTASVKPNPQQSQTWPRQVAGVPVIEGQGTPSTAAQSEKMKTMLSDKRSVPPEKLYPTLPKDSNLQGTQSYSAGTIDRQHHGHTERPKVPPPIVPGHHRSASTGAPVAMSANLFLGQSGNENQDVNKTGIV